MLFELKEKLFRLIRTFAAIFLKLDYVRKTPPLSIDPSDESKYLETGKVFWVTL